jgi:CRP-like cAMP-binding protein
MDTLKGFRTLPEVDRTRLAAATRVQAFERGATVFGEGAAADRVWAVKAGLVHIVKFGASGRELVAEVIPPGELFGAIVALEDRPYPATAVSAEASLVGSIPATLARALCQKYPALRAAILEQVTTRLRAAHDRLQSVALEPVEQRLARLLLTLADKFGRQQDGMLVVSATRQELADMIGTTVETAIRITSKWQRDGIVRGGRQALGLADPATLRAIAQGEHRRSR